jgi:protein-S-isoprenylcysteine O-methyltransferase Ste14
LLAAVAFFGVWVLDSFLLHFSDGLSESVPLAIRLVAGGIMVGLAIWVFRLAEKVLFREAPDEPGVIDTGILGHVRHPLYLSELLVYIGLALGTLSLLALGTCAFVLLALDRIARYEERDLVRLFGESYVAYQKQVPKWLPRIFARKPRR